VQRISGFRVHCSERSKQVRRGGKFSSWVQRGRPKTKPEEYGSLKKKKNHRGEPSLMLLGMSRRLRTRRLLRLIATRPVRQRSTRDRDSLVTDGESWGQEGGNHFFHRIGRCLSKAAIKKGKSSRGRDPAPSVGKDERPGAKKIEKSLRSLPAC